MEIKLFYYSKGCNFGDVISPYILREIFKQQFSAVDSDEADLFMLGSILGKAFTRRRILFPQLKSKRKEPLYIWSSGFIKENLQPIRTVRKLNICALRGQLSRQQLEQCTGQKTDAVLGDGGLLISRLFATLPEKKYPIGIVPHFADENLPEIEELQKKLPGSVVISPVGDPLQCAEKIAGCETILSSSLHGLIAADSFGIPNQQIIVSSNIKGGLFKYNDYYSAFGLTARPVAVDEIIKHGITKDTICSSYRLSKEQIVERQELLLESFPFR